MSKLAKLAKLATTSPPASPAISSPVPIRVIVVDNDGIFRDMLTHSLSKLGYDIINVSESGALYRELINHSIDIVILETDLLGDSGLTIAAQLRSMHKTRLLGIVILTCHTELKMRIDGLDSGADVVIAKPVTASEIHAQLQSLYRRLSMNTQAAGPTPWEFIKTEWKLITPSNVEIPLTHLETLLIDILASNNGEPVRRKDIISTALNQNPMAYDERRLEAIISRLRRKISKYYALSQPIKVAHSIGYSFADQIERR